MKKGKKSGKKSNQQGESPGGNKTATINGISAEKQNIIEETPNTGKSIDNNKVCHLILIKEFLFYEKNLTHGSLTLINPCKLREIIF